MVINIKFGAIILIDSGILAPKLGDIEARKVMEMKFIAYWEFEAKDADKVAAKYAKMSEIRKKPTDLYPKSIFPSYYTGPTNGFLILEGDDHQLANYTLFYFPEMRITYVPLIEAAEVAEKYQKLK